MLDWMSELFDDFADAVINVLPHSPFRGFIESLDGLPGLSWLNWVIPIGECLKIMAAWLVAVAGFYAVSLILRWLKLIGD